MNKKMLRKSVHHLVRLWPVARRFNDFDELPRIDDDWIVRQVNDIGVEISNLRNDHSLILGFDHIREYISDPNREYGDPKFGILELSIQLFLRGNMVNIAPIPLYNRRGLTSRRN